MGPGKDPKEFRKPEFTLIDLELSGRTARNGSEVAALLGGSMGEVDWWDRLPGIAAPTLILHGRSDPTPSAMARAMEDAQTFVRAATTFLASLER